MSDNHSPKSNPREYFEGKIVAAIEPAEVDAVVKELTSAGFVSAEIDVIGAADVADTESPLDRPGFGGFMGRLLMSMGADLRALERMQEEIADGHVLVVVPVTGEDTKNQFLDVLSHHGGHSMMYFGRWTITPVG